MALIITTDPDVIPNVFEELAGVFIDGTDPADVIDHGLRLVERIERQSLLVSGANSDAATEAWLAGEEV